MEREIRGEGESGSAAMMRGGGVAWRQCRSERGGEEMERSTSVAVWIGGHEREWWRGVARRRQGLAEVWLGMRIDGGEEWRSEAQWRRGSAE